MKRIGLFFLIIALVLALPLGASLAASSEPPAPALKLAAAKIEEPTVHHHPDPAELPKEYEPYIGIEENLGGSVPLDATFADEEGKPVSLSELINKPTIVAFVYYTCRDVCPLLLHELASVVDKVPAEPLKDYQVLTVSFDSTDTPELAAKKKRNFLASLENPFPHAGWRFLTGDDENIHKVTDAVGFKFKRQGDIFLHPIALVVLSPKGKVIRYLYGSSFLPLDVKMALVEASEGRFGPTITQVLKFCYTYDPKGRKYALNILRVVGASMLFMVVVMLIILRVTGKSQARKEE